MRADRGWDAPDYRPCSPIVEINNHHGRQAGKEDEIEQANATQNKSGNTIHLGAKSKQRLTKTRQSEVRDIRKLLDSLHDHARDFTQCPLVRLIVITPDHAWIVDFRIDCADR